MAQRHQVYVRLPAVDFGEGNPNTRPEGRIVGIDHSWLYGHTAIHLLANTLRYVTRKVEEADDRFIDPSGFGNPSAADAATLLHHIYSVSPMRGYVSYSAHKLPELHSDLVVDPRKLLNHDGITIIDLTDLRKPQYAFMRVDDAPNAELKQLKAFEPVDARTYLTAYYPESSWADDAKWSEVRDDLSAIEQIARPMPAEAITRMFPTMADVLVGKRDDVNSQEDAFVHVLRPGVPITAESYARVIEHGELERYQDGLDALFQERLIDIRNALREHGWQGEPFAPVLSKANGTVIHEIDAEFDHVGAGRNVVGITWRVRGEQKEANASEPKRVVDDLIRTPAEMAVYLDELSARVAVVETDKAPEPQQAVLADRSAAHLDGMEGYLKGLMADEGPDGEWQTGYDEAAASEEEGRAVLAAAGRPGYGVDVPPTRESIAKKYAVALAIGRDGVNPEPTEFHYQFADAVLNKDAYRLEYLANGLNDVGKQVFSEVTCIDLPKQQGKTWEVLRAWAGVSAEQDTVVRTECTMHKAKKALERTGLSAKAFQWADDRVAEGYRKVVSMNRARYLVNDQGAGFNLSKRGSRLNTLIPYIEARVAHQDAIEALTDDQQSAPPKVDADQIAARFAESPDPDPQTASAIAGFEEINRFLDTHRRAPSEESRDPLEQQLAWRLDAMLANPDNFHIPPELDRHKLLFQPPRPEEFAMNKAELSVADRQGWGVFEIGAGRWEIQRIDERDKFLNHHEAVVHVMHRALTKMDWGACKAIQAVAASGAQQAKTYGFHDVIEDIHRLREDGSLDWRSRVVGPKDGPLQVGQRVYCSPYGGTYGVITKVSGDQDPGSTQRLIGVLAGGVSGGQAHFDVLLETGGRSVVPESLVRQSAQWKVFDAVASPAEVRVLEQYAEVVEAQRKRDSGAKSRNADEERARLIAENEARPKKARLQMVEPGNYASAKLAATNIRKELRAAFPGIKFSVRSSVFSGGDSVDVQWTDGPTENQIDAIIQKYQKGRFNGMEDIYEVDYDKVYPQLFGGAKYVQRTRDLSDRAWQGAADRCFGKYGSLADLALQPGDAPLKEVLRQSWDDNGGYQHVTEFLRRHDLTDRAFDADGNPVLTKEERVAVLMVETYGEPEASWWNDFQSTGQGSESAEAWVERYGEEHGLSPLDTDSMTPGMRG